MVQSNSADKSIIDELLPDSKCAEFLTDFPDGLTTEQICDFFQDLGIKLSMATFRKYIQFGLFKRSSRVGNKGKHQGSYGLYSPRTIARIKYIKKFSGNLKNKHDTVQALADSSIIMLWRYEDDLDECEARYEWVEKNLSSSFKKESSLILFQLDSMMKSIRKNISSLQLILKMQSKL